jgi:hypothetical protein
MGFEEAGTAGAGLAVAPGEHERNEVFTALVSSDSDIVGLVAYSIYKQNKLDWLVAFGKQKSRDPNEAELAAYILGESTPRRLAIYRHLAQATLEGRGPDVASGGPVGKPDFAIVRQQPVRAASRESGKGTIIAFAGLVIVALVAVYFAARFGIPGIVSAR